MKVALHLLNRIRRGGGENVALNYSKILAELGVASYIVGKHDSRDFEEYISDTVGIYERLSIKRIKQADYIFVHTNANLFKLFFFYFFFLKSSRKKIFYIQHLFFSRSKFRVLSVFINAVCTDFIRITPITAEFVDQYIRIRRHFIVNFYISKYREADYPVIRQTVRRELNIDDHKTVFIFSSVLKPGKRVEDFLALAGYYRDREDFVFLLLGDGPEASAVRDYPGKNLIWAGMVDDVEKYLIAGDIYVFTSKVEMMPMTLIEAINTGKKILAYNTEINRFLLNNEVCTTFEDFQIRTDRDLYPHKPLKYNREYALAQIKGIL
jgi:glycosyltransferase involved in cell wall biosynthesis